MLDLRKKALPNTVTVGGRALKLKTDFRNWISYSDLINNGTLDEVFKSVLDDSAYAELSKYAPLPSEIVDELLEQINLFYRSPSITPKASNDNSNIKVIDFVADGEYIYASFMQAYGIDLVEVNMHWHKFKALFFSLPNDTKIGRVISYRAYEKTDEKQDEIMERLREQWSFDIEMNKAQQDALDEFNSLFE